MRMGYMARGIPPGPEVTPPARSRPVALLELLARAAPARVVAADLLVLVHPSLLHVDRLGDLVDLSVGGVERHLTGSRRGGHGQSLPGVDVPAARVRDAPAPRRRAGRRARRR